MDQDYYEGTDYLSPVPADGERTEEFEYEVGTELHITAHKSLTYSLFWLILPAYQEYILDWNLGRKKPRNCSAETSR